MCERDAGLGRASAREPACSAVRGPVSYTLALVARCWLFSPAAGLDVPGGGKPVRPGVPADAFPKLRDPPACPSAEELACVSRCKGRGLMRGAGGQVEISVVNGAKVMLQSAAARDDVLGTTRGFRRMWWSALGPGAKVDRCLLSSSRSRAWHCSPKVENSKPLTGTERVPLTQITSTVTLAAEPCAVFPRSAAG